MARPQAHARSLQGVRAGGHGGRSSTARSRCTCRRPAIQAERRPQGREGQAPGRLADERIGTGARRFADRGRRYPASTCRSAYGVLAPKDTPPAIVERLNKAFREVLAQPALRAKFSSFGAVAGGSAPAELSQRIVGEVAKWRGTIQSAGIAIQ